MMSQTSCKNKRRKEKGNEIKDECSLSCVPAAVGTTIDINEKRYPKELNFEMVKI